jgi:4-hydroxy-3-methylbut-2-enyl diphosphate reductase
MNQHSFNILLANPRGFCAGVDRAIEIVKRALKLYGAPIYVRHEVVHNQFVVNELKASGAVFVDELSDVPDDAIVIFSAHGVAQQVRKEAEQRKLQVFDATCPLVTKVHMEVVRYSRKGYECILIGHAKHPEVEGTMGQYNNPEGGIYLVETAQDVQALQVKNSEKLAFVTQTTLSVDDTQQIIQQLRARFPNIIGPNREDICYATQNRQDAVKRLAQQCDLVLVVGSTSSSNSNRLREIAAHLCGQAYLIDGPEDIQTHWLQNKQQVGVTAGASAPEILVQNVMRRLQKLGGKSAQEISGVEEHVVFGLPQELKLNRGKNTF